MKYIKFNMLSILLILSVLTLSTVSAFTANTFNNSLQQENLTLVKDVGIVRYLAVPSSVSLLTTALFNITYPAMTLVNTTIDTFDQTTFNKTLWKSPSTGAGAGIFNTTGGLLRGTGSATVQSNFSAFNASGDLFANGATEILFDYSTIRAINPNGNLNMILKYLNNGTNVAGGTIFSCLSNGADYIDDDAILRIKKNGNNISWSYDPDASVSNCFAGGGANGSIILTDLNANLSISHQTSGSTATIDIKYVNRTTGLLNQNLSVSLDDDLLASLSVNATGTNVNYSINSLTFANSYLSSCSIVNDFCYIPFVFNTTLNISISYSFLNFNSAGFAINNETYNINTTEGASETFGINMNYSSPEFVLSSANLIYNGTAYSSTSSGSAGNGIFSSTISIPYVSATTFYNFYWNFMLLNSSGSAFSVNSTSHQQQVNNLGIDNCSTFSNKLININLYNQDTRATSNGTVEYIVSLFTPGTNNIVANYSSSAVNVNQTSVCVQSLNATYAMYYQMKYYGANGTLDYLPLYKYLQNSLVNSSNIPQRADLYLLANTTNVLPFTITVQGSNIANLVGAIVDVQRQYIPINQFISVQAPITDASGNAVAYLLINNQVYNFNVYQNGVLLGSFNNYVVTCSNPTAGCSISLNLALTTPNVNNINTSGNISYYYLSNNSQIQLVFSSIDNLVHNVSWYVVNDNGYNNQTICTNTITALSGTFICNIPNQYVNSTVISTVFSDGEFLGTSFFSFGNSAQDIFGGARVIIGLLMYSTIVLLFLGSVTLMIVGAVLGMAMAGAFHLVDGGTLLGNTAILGWFMVAGGIIWVYSRNKT